MPAPLFPENDYSQASYAHNESTRVFDLLSFDLDYSVLEKEFKDLTTLAAHVAGTEISLLNLIDLYTQWTVAGHGFPKGQIPRENSICQYTILEDDHFEVKNLLEDERFKNLAGINDGPMLRYYFGIPLRSPDGNNIGALCVMDRSEVTLSSDRINLLKTLAGEIEKRLVLLKEVRTLRTQLAEARAVNKRVAHDVRGPIGGIIGLAQRLIRKEGKSSPVEVLKISQMMHKSGSSLLALADEIMRPGQLSHAQPEMEDGITLFNFKQTLEQLFLPQASGKAISFGVHINEKLGNITFTKTKLMQIVVNLVSNALKFTPPLGEVSVSLDLTLSQNHRIVNILVQDTGIGLSQEQVDAIVRGQAPSTSGTQGEIGYGMGLQLVRHLLESLHGTMQLQSTPGQGTSFELSIPIGRVAHLE
ncbi:GAF domain-containing sensor histidine kinase [Pontibacter sp. HSC-14F20]|uniref:GAF domain-containing sensor histidine kinase n=1 Tax=Pontibacter sp. HSC-14F20 TaxID=2864136 RepID=UPI001C739705|nr:GAF domain-containing sensor histidine kinase [Pontibacter sp. HSC-14F20]MBX0331891.1 GAF domain-containing sensor histidine kinase [Pontibacter sp. HSC-14F20]